ncbi:MAG: phosphatidate cytidylyltransferase [Candidatus Eisenbacteria bacterium]|nr:phosphatidate cytidylyltransferase [Candidatus Eisenbacteria bacterium]
MRGSNLLLRTLVAAAFIPLYVFITIHGGIGLFVVNLAIVLGAVWEFCRLGRPHLDPEVPLTMAVCGGTLYLMATGHPGPASSLAILPFLIVLGLDVASGTPRQTLLRASRAAAAVLYIAWLFGHVHLLRLPGPKLDRWGIPPWKLALIPFYLTWIVDTAAYGFGRAFGRTRLAPVISPKKSWEGAVAGFAAGLAAGGALCVLGPLPLPVGLLLGGIAGSLGQVADLAESLFKREVCVKDSSCLIPGHGGVLDRFDSLLLNIPGVYYALVLVPGRS